MVAAAGTIGAWGTIVYIGGIFVFFAILAALAECAERADDLRRRRQARAEARATRRKEQESSDAEWGFSWQ